MRIVAALIALVSSPLCRPCRSPRKKRRRVKGLFLLTDYPAVTVRPGTTTTVNLRLRNYALPPERFALAVTGVPSGWTVTLLGGGQPVGGRDGRRPTTAPRCSCALDVPANAAMGTAEPHRHRQGPVAPSSPCRSR